MGEGRIRQRKSLGQVFLNTDWPVNHVAQTMLDWGVTRVIEIGPGGAILTKALLKAGLKVTALEKDDRFAEKLEDYYRTNGDNYSGTLEVINIDVLKYNLPAWIKEHKDEKLAVIGNIPYNISSPILMWVLPFLKDIVGVQFLTQLEFADRIAAKKSTKAYGSLSVYCQLRSTVVKDCDVGRELFTPVPKVDSAIFTLKHRDSEWTDSELKYAEKVAKAAFLMRRKMLRNSMKQFMSAEEMENSPIELTRRPDSLYPEEYIELGRYVLSLES